jgi:hypothetical protein
LAMEFRFRRYDGNIVGLPHSGVPGYTGGSFCPAT